MINDYSLPADHRIAQGWEETVDANLIHLLKTSLAKNARESASMNTTSITVSALAIYLSAIF
jgi:hypothetical protein